MKCYAVCRLTFERNINWHIRTQRQWLNASNIQTCTSRGTSHFIFHSRTHYVISFPATSTSVMNNNTDGKRKMWIMIFSVEHIIYSRTKVAAFVYVRTHTRTRTFYIFILPQFQSATRWWRLRHSMLSVLHRKKSSSSNNNEFSSVRQLNEWKRGNIYHRK